MLGNTASARGRKSGKVALSSGNDGASQSSKPNDFEGDFSKGMKSEVLPLTVSLLHYYDKALEIWASMLVGKNKNGVFMWARYDQQPTNKLWEGGNTPGPGVRQLDIEFRESAVEQRQ
uniref:Uncharacterized protein n=1 Tax=Cucumis melo TaxID=3656 RepID=A0A9I9EDB3_CUCME